MIRKAVTPVFFIIIFIIIAFPCVVRADLINKDSLKNPQILSNVLLKQSEDKDPLTAERLLLTAAKIYPDNPAIYFMLFKKTIAPNPTGFVSSLRYLYRGLAACRNNFWWRFNLRGVLIATIVITFFLLSLFIALLRLSGDTQLIIHEAEEDLKNASFLAVIPISFFGLPYLTASLLFLAFLNVRGSSRLTGYVLLTLLILVSPLGRYLDRYIGSGASPALKAAVSINEGLNSPSFWGQIKERTDFVSRFSYALSLQKNESYDEAIKIYKGILSKKKDARVYINLGNCYAGQGDLDNAGKMYQEAIKINPLPSAYYNLSIIARERLDFIKGDKLFAQAVKMDFQRITRFREVWSSINSMHFMSERLSLPELLRFARKIGNTGEGGALWKFYLFSIVALILIAILYIRRKSPGDAMRCPKCGKIFCLRCQKRLFWGGMCSECFRNMVSFETNPAERIEHILQTYRYREQRKAVLSVLTYIVPGASLILGNRFLAGTLFLTSFLFFTLLALLFRVFTFNIYPYSPGWLTLLSVLMMAVTYTLSLIYTRKRLKKGWL